MASATKKLKIIRKRKVSKQGKSRKAKLRAQGSTQSYSQLFGDEE